LESANAVNAITGNKHCKVFLTVHSHLSKVHSIPIRLVSGVAARLLYHKADKVISVSEGVGKDLINNYKLSADKVLTIHNGFNTESIRSDISYRRKNAVFTYITMGRFVSVKGHWHLIRALNGLRKKNLDCRLVILGDGPYRYYLEQLISEYDLTHVVRLTGFIENPYSELACADAFVFTSLYEGFGNAVVEAMACGLPVISSDYRSGAREILAPDTDIDFEQKDNIEYAKYGIITPVCSGTEYKADEPLEEQEALLAEAMEKLYMDKQMAEKYKSMSIERANHFSIERTVKKWITLISD